MSGWIKRADRLIAGAVLGPIVLTWALLVAFDAFNSLVRELDEIGEGAYTLATAAGYVAWTVPRRAVEMFPVAAVIGGLLGLGSLAPTSELTALRAGGMSKLRICAGAVVAIAAMVAAVVALGETAAPWGERQAQALAAGAKSHDLIATGRSGLWAREGDSLLNARRGEVRAEGVSLYDVRIYEFTPKGQLTRITTAERADHRRGAWTLAGVARFAFETESVTTESVATLPWPSSLDPDLLTQSVIRPQYLSARDLSASIAYLRRNGLDARVFESAFWERMFYPLNALVIVFAVLPFAFGALRSGGLGKRLFLGIVLAIGWYFFQRMVVNVASVYGVDHRIVHALPAIALIAAAVFHFRRTA
jgi:lipopolysaccharide export system permease protein